MIFEDHDSILLALESVHEVYESWGEVLSLDVGKDDYVITIVVLGSVEREIVEVIHDPGGHLLGTGLESVHSLGVLGSQVLKHLPHVFLYVFSVGGLVESGLLVAESVQHVQNLLGLIASSTLVGVGIGVGKGVPAADIDVVLSLDHEIRFDFGSDIVVDQVQFIGVRDDLVVGVEHVKVENHLLIIEATTIPAHVYCQISTNACVRSFGLAYFLELNLRFVAGFSNLSPSTINTQSNSQKAPKTVRGKVQFFIEMSLLLV